jgi:diguanylate cyclase (GGDEF)-like protein
MTDPKKQLIELLKKVDPSSINAGSRQQSQTLSQLLKLLAEEQLTEQAASALPSPKTSEEKDPLTQLPNRVFFEQYVIQAIHRSTRHKKPFALVFIDIDHFKTINDLHGHHAGDALLKKIAERLVQSIRKSDLLCRLAGDEFCLLVEELEKPESILKVIDAIKKRLSDPFEINDLCLEVTCSIGISLYPQDGKTFEELLHFADLAMYEAKRNGRNSVSVFTPEVVDKMRQLSSQQKRLTAALKFNQLKFQYQPELELKTGNICAVRQVATLPDSDMTDELSLKNAAAQGKKTSVLNTELIRAACLQRQTWQSHLEHIPRLVVPLFKELLCSPRCVELVRDQLSRFEVDGTSLEFEINEQDLNHECDHGLENINHLGLLGCKISLINFGIGPASLKLLSSGNIYKIKVDGTLISDIVHSAQSRLIMETLIELCLKLKIRVVALDVHQLEQVRLLESLKCDGIRGQYFSPLLNEDEFSSVLNRYNAQENCRDLLVNNNYRLHSAAI